jgi:hypothetical protein
MEEQATHQAGRYRRIIPRRAIPSIVDISTFRQAAHASEVRGFRRARCFFSLAAVGLLADFAVGGGCASGTVSVGDGTGVSTPDTPITIW